MRLVLTALLLGLATPALAQQAPCAPRDTVIDALRKQFGEESVYIGTAGSTMAEITLSDKGSWTLVITFPDGRSCILAGGKDWQETGNKPGITGKGA